jgi:transposase
MAIRELRELCRGRHTLVQMRTRLLQRVRAILLRQGIVEARRLVRNDAVLDTLVLPPRATASVMSLRRTLAAVRREIEAVDREVQAVAASDPIAQRLQRIPGINREANFLADSSLK